MLPSEFPRLTTDSPVRVFPGVWKLLFFLRLPSREGSPSLTLLYFYLLYFVLLPLEDNACMAWTVTHFQRVAYRKGKNNNFTV